MKKLLFLFLFISSVSIGQKNQFHLNNTIPVTRYGHTLRIPWAGGINQPQWSEIDLNRDGKPDLFLFDRDNNRITTLINNGGSDPNTFLDSTFKYAPMFPTGIDGWATLYDYDCDGLPDLFTPSALNSGIMQYKASYNNGMWKFTVVDSIMMAKYGASLSNIFASSYLTPAFDDIDGDGDMDIIGQNLVCVGAFSYYRNYSMEHTGRCDSLNDYKPITNSWGHFALRTGNYPYVAVDSNFWHITCAPAPISLKWQSPYVAQKDDTYAQIFPIDLNGDSLKDALIGDSQAKNVLALYNIGTQADAQMDSMQQDTLFPSLSPSHSTPAIIENFSVMGYIDIDNDGKKDLLVGPREFENMKDVMFYKNSGSNSAPVFNYQNDSVFQSEMIDVGQDAAPVFFDDDGDGMLDLIIPTIIQTSATYPNSKSQLTLYRNVGTKKIPAFQFVTDDYQGIGMLGLPGPLFPAFGDLDGDGDLDMLVGMGNGKLAYFENIAACGTCPANFQFRSANFDSIDVGNNSTPQIFNLDGDSLLDLVIGGKDGFIKFYKNTGTKNSPAFSFYPTIDTLGKVSMVPPFTNFVDGYSVPYVYNDSGLKLLVTGMGGYVLLYDSVTSNPNDSFPLIDTVLNKYYGNRYGPNLTISGGDINDDGFTDFIIGLYTGGVQIYEHDVPVSVAELSKPTISFDVFPNPASESLTLRFNNVEANKNYQLSIFNSIGEVVYPSNLKPQASNLKPLTIDLNNFSNGLYLLKLQTDEQSVSRKIVVNHSR